MLPLLSNLAQGVAGYSNTKGKQNHVMGSIYHRFMRGQLYSNDSQTFGATSDLFVEDISVES